MDSPGEWDSVLQSLDSSSRFLCSEWTKLLAKTYGYTPYLIVLQDNTEVTGVLPYVVVRSVFTGTRAISLPFFDICRAYAKSNRELVRLYEEFKAEGKRAGWDYIELRGDVHKLPVEKPSLSFYNHTVELDGGPEAIFSNMAPSNRRAIRKAEKLGVRIEFSDTLDALNGFYKLQCITRKRHGLPPQPFHFFENIHSLLISEGKGTIISAFADGELAASGVYLEQGSIAHYKYGASDTKFQGARCNNLIMWSALKHYSNKGFSILDLGRNSLENDGLRKYKLTWGSKEHITHYHRYNLKKDQPILMSDDVFGWHNKIFSNLPIPLAQLAGRMLYKHIA